MKNFKEIAEKCLKGELSGTFITIDGGHIKSNRIKKAENGYYTFDQWHYYDPVGCCLTGKYTWNIINFIPDMKENDKRTIQISLQQAREWYKSGNNTLKTLALSSFSEKELDPYPRSWEEFEQIHGKEIFKLSFNYFKTSAILMVGLDAYIKLLHLKNDWIHIWSQEQGLEKDWEPIWSNCNKYNYCVEYTSVGLEICNYAYKLHSLSFPTMELAQNFLETFKSLLVKAKGLY